MLPPTAGTHGAGTPSGGLDTAPEGLTFITDPDTGIRNQCATSTRTPVMDASEVDLSDERTP